jgi:hypothetical protein
LKETARTSHAAVESTRVWRRPAGSSAQAILHTIKCRYRRSEKSHASLGRPDRGCVSPHAAAALPTDLGEWRRSQVRPADNSTDKNPGTKRPSPSNGLRREETRPIGKLCRCGRNPCVLCHGFHITKRSLTIMKSTLNPAQPEALLFPLRCCQSYFQETSIPPSLTETATTVSLP